MKLDDLADWQLSLLGVVRRNNVDSFAFLSKGS